MNHAMIKKWQAEKAITVKQGCELFAISRAGYYAAQRRKLKPQPLCPIKMQLKTHFEASDRSYGSRRLLVDLNNKGIRIGRYRVRSLMKEMNIKPIWKPKFVNTTDSNHSLPIFVVCLIETLSPWPQIKLGSLILPTFELAVVGYIWRLFWTYIRVKLWVGQWHPRCLQNWCVPLYN